ncbi:DeoR/GlpR transcriptional regulator [Mesobaculum littorinae]|uniref:DeoR/GlpR transcriptional regulator n=1 Tax=Mesobaculum littorinae TaxID=2486419 RepID=A0A438AN17_9RHOB|nr:DeoR/GlpR family DNA-binding transcription regulator [Mesobaculum littorinae]RVW00011.1 DeoR/GlpR transcriptional regulator [Mesobaculum littorinae]
MSQTIRHPEIIEIARRDGKVTVERLSAHFGVTHQTIRRDLADLAEAGRLERVHGGAVLPSGTTNIGYADRRQINAAAKDAIAAACAEAIPNESSVFLNIGTTPEAVARHMLAHRNLLVVTNNMNVGQILVANPDCDVVVTGGALRPSDGGLIGDVTTTTIRRFKFDVAVIGCSALDEDGDLLDFDMQEVGVTRAILQHARKVFLVSDGSKFQRKAPVRVASVADLDAFFTDVPPPPGFVSRCKDEGVAVTVAACANPAD